MPRALQLHLVNIYLSNPFQELDVAELLGTGFLYVMENGMSGTNGKLLGLMVDHYRKTGEVNAVSATELIKSLAETAHSSQELAELFDENIMQSQAFTEINNE